MLSGKTFSGISGYTYDICESVIVFNQEDWSSLHDMFGKMVQKLELCDWDDEDHSMAGHLTVLTRYGIEQIWSVG